MQYVVKFITDKIIGLAPATPEMSRITLVTITTEGYEIQEKLKLGHHCDVEINIDDMRLAF